MVELINALEPFGSLGVTVTALGRALRVLGSSPPVLSALAAGAVLSVAALVQLSHLLAAPQRRRSSHA
jgi:hypothetical protein